jgi:hypothetical protein
LLAVVTATPVAVSDLAPADYTQQFRRPDSWDPANVPASLALRLAGALSDYATHHLREAIIPLGGGAREMELGRRLGVADLPAWTGLMAAALIAIGSFAWLQGQGVSPGVLLFEGLYLAAICAWHWRDARLLYPIQPFLYYQFLIGIGLVAGRLNFGWLRGLSGAAVGLAAFALLAVSVYKGLSDQRRSVDFSRDFRVGAAWLKDNSAADSLVMAQYAHTVYLYGGRGTIGYPAVEDAAQLETSIRQLGVDYVLVAPRVSWRLDGSLTYSSAMTSALLPAVKTLAAGGRLKLVYESAADRVQVYQVVNSQ